jgi:hypothetical protein
MPGPAKSRSSAEEPSGSRIRARPMAIGSSDIRSSDELIGDLPAIVWRADAKTFQYTFVSKYAETLRGYPVRDWTDEPSFWVNHIFPEDREFIVRTRTDSIRAVRTYDLEYRMIAADGRALWVRDLVGVKATYTYDMGDSWEHGIVLEKRLPIDPGRPIRSARAANVPVRLKIAAVSADFTSCWMLSEIPCTNSTRNSRIGLAKTMIPTLSPSRASIRCSRLCVVAGTKSHALSRQHGKQILSVWCRTTGRYALARRARARRELSTSRTSCNCARVRSADTSSRRQIGGIVPSRVILS